MLYQRCSQDNFIAFYFLQFSFYNLTLGEIYVVPILLQASWKPVGFGLIQTCFEECVFLA